MGGGAARKLLTALATLQLLPAPTTGAHIAECTSRGAGARAGDGDDCLRRALLLDGAVALTVPGMAAARRDALQAAAACPAGSEIALPDGTSRRSLAASTSSGVTSPLIPSTDAAFGAAAAADAGAAAAAAACGGIEDATAAMRALVDRAARRVLGALQPLQRGPAALLAAGGGSYPSLDAVAMAGEQLEHFHTYTPRPRAPGSQPPTPRADAVPLHTDAGLFIALVPALHLAAVDATTPNDREQAPVPAPASGPGGAPGAAEDGFYVQRWDGERVRLAPEASHSSVVFVIGEAWAQFLNPRLTSPLRVAPHGMVMPPHLVSAAAAAAAAPALDGATLAARAWYGRMYLPPPDAVQRPGGVPFGAWREYHTTHPSDLSTAAAAGGGGGGGGWPSEANGNLSVAAAAATAEAAEAAAAAAGFPSGCGGGRRFLQTSDASNCLADQVFCWHQCVDVSSLPCGTDAVCWRHADDSVWQPTDAHCASCEVLCIAPSPPPSPPFHPAEPPSDPYVAPFCTGAGTDMHMSGFAFYPTDCVILLFHEWKLDTAASFAGGVLGVFALGVATELLTWLRKNRIATSAYLAAKGERAFKAAMGLAFFVQVTLGYFLMLAAMTYQGELFLAVVVGLGVGHVCFNVRAPVAESTDACCVEAAPPQHLPNRASSTRAVVQVRKRVADGDGAAASVSSSSAACPACDADDVPLSGV